MAEPLKGRQLATTGWPGRHWPLGVRAHIGAVEHGLAFALNWCPGVTLACLVMLRCPSPRRFRAAKGGNCIDQHRDLLLNLHRQDLPNIGEPNHGIYLPGTAPVSGIAASVFTGG